MSESSLEVNTMSFKSAAVTIGLLVVVAMFILGAGPKPPVAPPHPEGPDRVFFFSAGGVRLGVQIADITADRARALGLKEEIGAEIKGVLPDSPAAAAGLKDEDVIVEYQGTRVQGVAQLTRMVDETPAGRTVKIQIVRDKAPRTISVTLAERGEDEEVLPGHHFRMPRMRMRDFDVEVPDIDLPEMFGPPFGPMVLRLGAQVEDLNEQLGAFFGVKNGEGVLVRSVHKGGPGDAAGLKAGDVIVKVDAEKIADHADLRTALRDRKGKPVTLVIMRERRETTLKVTAPAVDRPSTGDGEDEGDDAEGGDRDSAQIRKEMKRIKIALRDNIREEAACDSEKLRNDMERIRTEIRNNIESALKEIDAQGDSL